MLVLTRRPLESVMIGDGITVTVLGIKGNHIRLGFKCPADVKILREELIGRPQPDHPEAA